MTLTNTTKPSYSASDTSPINADQPLWTT